MSRSSGCGGGTAGSSRGGGSRRRCLPSSRLRVSPLSLSCAQRVPPTTPPPPVIHRRGSGLGLCEVWPGGGAEARGGEAERRDQGGRDAGGESCGQEPQGFGDGLGSRLGQVGQEDDDRREPQDAADSEQHVVGRK